MAIRQLASDVIDQIAAGEVIERPASVLKELLENALDAGAQHVQVTLEGGGLSRLMVEDNGSGMSLADLRLCVVRHATSKLWHAEDLFNIRTLGFRGEALSSIASVSRLTITTRRADDPVGHRLALEAGRVVMEEDVGCPVGTVIDVRDLFFNVPARRKFLRSPATEQAHAVEAALRVMLGHADAGIILQAGGRRLLDIPHGTDPIQRVLAALGRRVDQIVPFHDDVPYTGGAKTRADEPSQTQQIIHVSGFITPPGLDRADAKGIWVFVNGRYVRDRMLQRAVIDSYSGLLAEGRYPTVIVSIAVDPTTLDVNVHPQKTEVRFSDSGAVFRAVSYALARALLHAAWADRLRTPPRPHQETYESTPSVSKDSAHTPWPNDRPGAAAHADGGMWVVPDGDDSAMGALQTSMALNDASNPVHPSPWDDQHRGFFARLGFIGKLSPRYALLAGQDGALVCVDLHTAQIHIAFAGLIQAWQSGCLRQAPLLFPAIVTLDAAKHVALTDHAQRLLCYGVEIDAVGPQRFAVRSVPACLAHVAGERIAHALLDGLVHGDTTCGMLLRLARLTATITDGDPSDPHTVLTHLDHAIAVIAGSGMLVVPSGTDVSAKVVDRPSWSQLGALWGCWSQDTIARTLDAQPPEQ